MDSSELTKSAIKSLSLAENPNKSSSSMQRRLIISVGRLTLLLDFARPRTRPRMEAVLGDLPCMLMLECNIYYWESQDLCINFNLGGFMRS